MLLLIEWNETIELGREVQIKTELIEINRIEISGLLEAQCNSDLGSILDLRHD